MGAESNILKAKLYAPELPWNIWDPRDLGPSVINFMKDHDSYFRRWSDTWYENFQFLFGNHNIRWSKRWGFAVDYDFLRRGNGFAMRAQTNIARVVAEALTALVYSNLPAWAANAMSESSVKGKRFAKIVEKILDAYAERLNMDREWAAAAMMYVVFGQYASKVDWDHNAGKMLEVPKFQKVRAPMFTTYMAPNQMTGGLIEVPTQAVDAQGQAMFEERWEAVVDATGRQVIDRFFAGDVRVNMLTPMQYRREPGTYAAHKSRWWEEFRLMDYDQYLDEYEDLPGQTDQFNKIRPVFHDPLIYAMAVRHFMRMQFTTPPTIDDGMRQNESVVKSQLFKHKVFIAEHWDKPHPKKWPLGRRLVIVNGVCTHITTPSYHTNKLDGWHPYTESQWMTVAPNSIAAGPMNDVIRKNRELDIKDSLVATAVRRNMGSQLLIKSGSGLDPQRLSGTPGEAHECSDPYGVRWLHDDMPIPPVINQLRQNDKDDVYEVSGAGDALRGQPSTGASSGYQEKQREEREEKRLTPARKNFRMGVAGTGQKMVACLKANVVSLDDQVMGYMKRAAAGEFTMDDVNSFLYNQIDFGVDISVEEESMELKSKATKQATMQEVAAGQAVSERLSTDAKVLDEYLKEFGMEMFRGSSAPHRDRAQRENEVFLDLLRLGPSAQKRPIVLMEDDDDIHMAEHAETFLQNTEEILGNEQFLIQFLAHVEQHRLQKQEKAATLAPGTAIQVPAMMQAGLQQPPPSVPTIFQHTMMEQQQQQQAAKKGQVPAGPGQKAAATPQAPSLPRKPGTPQGAGPTNPQAPSQNTPSAAPPAK